MQLLDLSVSESFDIVQLQVDVDENYSTVDNQAVYTLALENLPDVKSAETKLKSSERSLAISQEPGVTFEPIG